MAAADPTIACVGDSALWCTGTRYEDKTPNLVHKMLTGSDTQTADGDPIPPAQFRARGGAVIGVDYPYRITRLDNFKDDGNGTPDWLDQLRTKKDECQTHIDNNGFSADACKVKIGPEALVPNPRKHAKIQLNQGAEYLAEGDVYGFIKHDANDWYNYYSTSDKSDINQLKWTIARDIGWHWPRIVDQIEQFPTRGSSKPDLDVPRDGTDTVKQFDGPVDTKPPYAEDVDVLMLNGGTNDIELGWLNNPTRVLRPGIMNAVAKHCYHDQKTLLQKARQRFPNAIIFLVGYFPYASDWTWRKKAKAFLSAKAGSIGNVGAVVETATDNALNFARLQAHWMRKAVSEQARVDDGPGMVFVARGFGVVNAFDAPEAWSWGAPANQTDDTGQWREDACHAKHDSDDAACIQASIGHPNTPGCKQTADAIVDRYDGFVNRSVRGPTEEWTDGSPVSLRDACGNYKLDPQGDGLRYCLSHRVVDSIRVDIETGDSIDGIFKAPGGGGSQPSDPSNDVYLKIEPGRNGNAERFRLETENDDFQKGSTDRFFIDPMMGRQISATPGPVQNIKNATPIGMDEGTKDYQNHIDDGDDSHGPEHLTETDHPDLPYHRAERWDSKRLRLGMIERLSLDIVDTNPWALEDVAVEINGFIERSTNVSHGGDGVKGDVEIEIWER
ncbi:MAG: hypothetical protein V5A55_04175 [Halovenus sp.]